MARAADAFRAVTDTVPRPFSGPAQASVSGRVGGHARRSPVLAMLGSIAAAVTLALAFVFGPASGGSEPTVTGWLRA
jgi:hypothetical protein